MENIKEKIDELKAKGVYISRIERRDPLIGGITFEFWVDSEADRDHLPKAGEWAAETSLVIVKPTGATYALGYLGWDDYKFGG